MVPSAENQAVALPKCVMVVDDGAVIRMAVSESLRDAGLCVIQASRGAKAKAYLNSGGRVDLIFSDIEMAGPLDGLALARHVRTIYPDIPAILTSGSVKPAALDGVEIFIRKPYNLEGVIAMVTNTLIQLVTA